MSKRARKGKIFVDWLRNARGATAVLPYSARAREGLPVAMPIAWADLEKGHVDPKELDIRTVPALVDTRKKDPWADLLDTQQTLPKAKPR
jgi:bifunctional non-homologous end joining protein LigD